MKDPRDLQEPPTLTIGPSRWFSDRIISVTPLDSEGMSIYSTLFRGLNIPIVGNESAARIVGAGGSNEAGSGFANRPRALWKTLQSLCENQCQQPSLGERPNDENKEPLIGVFLPETPQ